MPTHLTPDDFKFFKDDPTGDNERYHLYLYFVDQTALPPAPDKFHHEWSLSRTELVTSGNRDARGNSAGPRS